MAELRQESCGIVLGETVRSPAHTVYKGTLLYIRAPAGVLGQRCQYGGSAVGQMWAQSSTSHCFPDLWLTPFDIRVLSSPGCSVSHMKRSTAVEVALKMAFRKFAVDKGLDQAAMAALRVLGLDNAYHGDTLGAMNAVPASPFNGPRQMPW